MEVTCKTKDTLELSRLVDFQGGLKNRTGDDVEKIITSIKRFGFATPFFVWSHDGINHVLDGHGRLLALRKLRSLGETIPPLPVVYVDCKDESQARQLLLRITSQYGTMTNQSVLEFMKGLKIDVSELALPKNILDIKLPEAPAEEEEVPLPVIVETRCKPGDIWEMDGHRLVCGDSTKPETIEKLMGGAAADMLLTDPPYNVAIVGGSHGESIQERLAKGAKTIQNDKMDGAAFLEFLKSAFKAADGGMRDGAAFYVWHADLEGLNFRKAIKENGWQLRECLVWNKNSLVMGRQDYQWKHEPCLYGWKDGAHYFTYSRRETTVIDQEKKNPEEMTKQELLEALREILDQTPATVIDCERPTRSADHPTMKPVKLFSYLIKNSSRPGEKILDTFAGSGTTLMACQQLGRVAYLCELDPHYCDVILQRWEEFTGGKAKKVN